MVWHIKGKREVHTGRTVRAPLSNFASKKDGYVLKVVENVEDVEESNRLLQRCEIADGFSSDTVLREAQRRQFWWDTPLFHASDLLLSLNKKKRWLLPSVVEETLVNHEFPQDLPRIALVKRETYSGYGFSSSNRLSKGDCVEVLDSHATQVKRESKTRKFSQVRDLYKHGRDPVIYYEVSSEGASNKWPNCKETAYNRDPYSKCYKGKMKKLERRNALAHEIHHYDDYDDSDDYVNDDEDSEMASYLKKPAPDSAFDIGAHIFSCLTGKKQTANDVCSSVASTTGNSNRPSSKPTQLHPKGSCIFIEEETSEEDEDSSEAFLPESIQSNPLLKTPRSATCGMSTIKLQLQTSSIQCTTLNDLFGSRYIEGQSHPRKFMVVSSQCHHQYLVFKPNDESNRSTNVAVTLVCDTREDSYPSEACFNDIKDCIHIFEQLQNQQRPLDVIDLDVLNCSCYKYETENETSQKMLSKCIKTLAPYDVLSTITGHTAQTYSPRTAFKKLDSTATVTNNNCTNTAIQVTDQEITEVQCGICFIEGETSTGYTCLYACNHWFCNDCWETYITSKIDDGNTHLTCPAFKCTFPVDEPTILYHAPNSFFKYQTICQDNAFQSSKEWNWCPGEKCNLAAKAISASVDLVPKSTMPYICTGCNTSWCFGCQKEPHWPATCKQAEDFRQCAKAFMEIKTGDIMSVSVKRCPMCQYPIDKDGGCSHMYCTRCNTSFCWNCGGQFTVNGLGCQCTEKVKVNFEEIPLVDEVGSKRFNRHVSILGYHRKARNSVSMVKVYDNVNAIHNAVMSFRMVQKSSKLGSTKSHASKPQLFLDKCSNLNIDKTLKLVVDIKVLSHIVIEGASMQMAISATKRGHRKLQRLCDDLHFIIKRLDFHLTKNIEELCCPKIQNHVDVLVSNAKDIILSIGRTSKSVK